ncbi:TNF receptor-associated factor 2-like isoform X2 [Ptychodera flava]
MPLNANLKSKRLDVSSMAVIGPDSLKIMRNISECEFKVIRCIKTGCTEQFQRRNLADHLEYQCEMRMIVCDFCKEDIVWKELKVHHDSCPKYPLTCEFCDKKNILREKFAEHIDINTGDCKKKVGPCAYNIVGCKAMVEVENPTKHMKKSQLQHLDLLFSQMSDISGRIEEFTRELDLPEMSRKTAEQQSKLERLEKQLNDLENKVTAVISQNQSQDASPIVGSPFEPIINQQATLMEELKNKMAILNTKVSTHEGVIAVLNQQTERDAHAMREMERKRREDKELIEALQRKIRAQDRIIALKDVALAEQDLRIQALEKVSYDGILVWKITDFTKKQQDALSGRTTSVYSPCFFTSRHGYKMCARIYLNGDGMGKGNHISLFFVVMKGPFDALLRWPFKQKVTFMLLDQNNREHIIDAFRPDPTSSSFKRPTSDMNIASGCPLFMPISQVDSTHHAYVKDDVMFMKVIVDTSDLA